MTIIKCNECGKELFNIDLSCPYCGKIKIKPFHLITWIIILTVIIVIVLVDVLGFNVASALRYALGKLSNLAIELWHLVQKML